MEDSEGFKFECNADDAKMIHQVITLWQRLMRHVHSEGAKKFLEHPLMKILIPDTPSDMAGHALSRICHDWIAHTGYSAEFENTAKFTLKDGLDRLGIKPPEETEG